MGKVYNIDNVLFYDRFLNGHSNKSKHCSKYLHHLIISIVKTTGESLTEKELCQFLVEMSKLNLTSEVKTYMTDFIINNNIHAIIGSLENGRLSYISEWDSIDDIEYGMEIEIVDESFKNRFARFFNNIIENPKEITIYDIDFILIGLLQETSKHSVKTLVRQLLSSIKLEFEEINTKLSQSIIYKLYDKEHLEFVMNGIRAVH